MNPAPSFCVSSASRRPFCTTAAASAGERSSTWRPFDRASAALAVGGTGWFATSLNWPSRPAFYSKFDLINMLKS
jgi:hypothetical protein